MEEDECKAEFKVRRDDIYKLTDTFGFPENFNAKMGLLLIRLTLFVFVRGGLLILAGMEI